MNINEQSQVIYKAYWDHKKGYLVSVEDFLVYLMEKWYNYAFWLEWTLIWNEMKDDSYFKITWIKLWVILAKQDNEVIEAFYKLIK